MPDGLITVKEERFPNFQSETIPFGDYNQLKIQQMRTKLLLLSFCLCLLVSCNKNKELPLSNSREISIGTPDGSVEDIIDTIIYLPLQVTGESALSRVHKIVTDDSLFFLADFNHSKISVYGRSGCLKYVLDKRGHGKGEYLEIRNFAVNGDRLYVIDNFMNKIHVFNKNTGTYIESKKNNVIASDIIGFDGEDFLLSVVPNGEPWSIEQQNYLVFRTDRNFVVKESYFPYDKDYKEPLSRYSYFTPADDGHAIFSSFAFDGYYEIDGDNIEKVSINVSDPLPIEKRGEIENYSSDACQFVAKTPMICGKYAYIETTKGNKQESQIYDLENDRLYGNGSDSAIKMRFIIAHDNNSFIAYIPDIKYYESLTPFGLKKADERTEMLLRKGGSALIFYKMKD